MAELKTVSTATYSVISKIDIKDVESVIAKNKD